MMQSLFRKPVTGILALVTLFLLIAPATADGWSYPYCSTQNTAGDFQALSWDWQSNGWCHDTCKAKGNYAFAVIQWKQCWCSNYIPEEQEDESKCQVHCPGFKTEYCGDQDNDLYIYVKLDGQPSGTQTTAKPTSANVSPSPSVNPSPSLAEASSSEAMTSEKSSEPSSTPTPETSAPAPSSSAADGEPVTSVRTLTQSGAIVTETLVIAPSPTSPTPAVTGQGKSKSNTGAIVGGVVGGVAGIAAIVGGVLFLLWRRRRQQRERQQEEEDFQNGVQRNTSTMSKAGLLRGEKVPQYPPRIATTFSSRHSRTLDTESISPVSGSDRRSSRPYIFDQRLNPSAIMHLDNTSRGSFASMDDARDYGRTLNVRNPDPDHH